MSIEHIVQKLPLKHQNHRNKLCHRCALEKCLVFCLRVFQRNIFMLGNAMSLQQFGDDFSFGNRVCLRFLFKAFSFLILFFLILVWFYYCTFNLETQKSSKQSKKKVLILLKLYSSKWKITSCLLKFPFVEYYGIIFIFPPLFVCFLNLEENCIGDLWNFPWS